LKNRARQSSTKESRRYGGRFEWRDRVTVRMLNQYGDG
jgi:hypothetical protein